MAIRLLIIDDDDALRESLVAYLEDSGFDMLQAPDGRQGVEVFRRERPDAILCDLRMPEMDGLEVLAEVTAESPETPFIVVSGVGVLGDVIHALRLGAWDYLTKPIPDMAMLEHAVHKALERATLLRQNREYRERLEEVNRELQERMYRLEQDEQAGRDIQFQLLPEPAKRYGPYSFTRELLTSLYLSGDFLDYFAIDDRYLGFYVADVSGHGVSSAFVTVLLHSSMERYRTQYRQGENDDLLHPARILARLNKGVVHSRVSKYLTMFYGVLDRETNTLISTNGGLFPCPILYDGQQAAFLADKSYPVGLFDFAEYREMRTELPERFILMLFSDGILETMPNLRLAEKRNRLLAQFTDPDLTLEALMDALHIDDRSMLPDDISLLMLKKEA